MPKALLVRLPVLGALLLGLAGCTVQSTETPDLMGPSEFGLSFFVAATPDAIPQDGSSTSSIVVRASDANGAPKSGVMFRVEIHVGGVPVQYGLLSGRMIVTGSDGTAATLYTAPPAPPAGAVLDTCRPQIFSAAVEGGCVDIVATPVGSNFTTANTQSARIHLVPRSVISGASTAAATPTFVVSPSAPRVRANVSFDASGSRAAAGRTIVGYNWSWGDGESTGVSSSPLEGHDYQSTGIFSVVLTITDDAGTVSSASRTIVIAP
jgi:hypothetical protein